MFVRNLELPGLLNAFGWTISVRTVFSTSLEAAREGGAESFFADCFGRALPEAAFLFGFFDGDTFDLYSRSIDVARITRRDGH